MKVAVVGCGTMGMGIAHVFALSGHEVSLVGTSKEKLEKAIEVISKNLDRMVAKEKIGESETTIVYKDFAHSPSKVKATVSAFKKQFTDRELVACLELHTFSSLNEVFLEEYKHSLNAADLPMVLVKEHLSQLSLFPSFSVRLLPVSLSVFSFFRGPSVF